MGQIVAAMATCHAPALFLRQPGEDPAQLDATTAAMRQLGDVLDATRPDALIILGLDHLEAFSMSVSPTFTVEVAPEVQGSFGPKQYRVPAHQELGRALHEGLLRREFDVAFSQGAPLGHAFVVPFEFVLEDRPIPVVPIFINVYVPPLPQPRRCYRLGRAIAEVVAERPERVALLASGGMSHYPGTRKYPTPEFDFDYWLISELEAGRSESLLKLSSEQLDETGNTELLTWNTLFGAIGNVPGELLQYTPTWHHGHGFMRFLPQRARKNPPMKVDKPFGGFQFKNAGFEFYKHPPASSYALNRLLFDVRHDAALRQRIITNLNEVAAQYGLDSTGRTGAQALIDVGNAKVVSDYAKPLVDAGAHPLQALMSLHVIYSLSHKAKKPAPAELKK